MESRICVGSAKPNRFLNTICIIRQEVFRTGYWDWAILVIENRLVLIPGWRLNLLSLFAVRSRISHVAEGTKNGVKLNWRKTSPSSLHLQKPMQLAVPGSAHLLSLFAPNQLRLLRCRSRWGLTFTNKARTCSSFRNGDESDSKFLWGILSGDNK